MTLRPTPRRLALLLAAAFLPGTFARAEEPKPADACRTAIEAVKAQPGYAATYKASIRKTRSDPFEQVGAAVRRGDLLYREGRREEKGPISVRLFRLKDRIAVLDPRTEDDPVDKQSWLTAEQAGDPNLGKGLEDPDVAMGFLLDAMAGATAGTGTETAGGVPCRPYALALDKQKLARKVRQQYESAKDLDWEKAEVSAQVLVGGEPALPRRFRINGVLPTQNRPDESVTLFIEVEVTSYGAATVPSMPPDVKEILGAK
jgi:hypothetical protein